MAQLLGVLEQGLIYAVLALGVYITFKILDFPDMTVDSTFPLGAAVTALMISNGIHPLLTLPASLLAGAAAGALTGVIHVKFHVRDLLSGIIMMTGLYSINLHIAGRANVQLFSFNTLFKNDFISGLPTGVQPYAPVILMALVALIVKLLMDAYLSTRSGFLLRATGDNPTLVASLAKDSGKSENSRSRDCQCARRTLRLHHVPISALFRHLDGHGHIGSGCRFRHRRHAAPSWPSFLARNNSRCSRFDSLQGLCGPCP